ncbi:PF04028 domain protein [Leptospira interrogans serovar Bataviae str. HAI135]|nr:PF04028 domain protein [Leptospira interrogans serovar Bataviae str. HAI135]
MADSVSCGQFTKIDRVDFSQNQYRRRKPSQNSQRKKPYILSIWHTNVLYSPYLNWNERAAVLISESKDGDFINQVVHRFGNYSIRGSSSKGGSKALKALIVHLKKIFLRRLLPTVLEVLRLWCSQV